MQLFINYMNLKYQTLYLSSQCYPVPFHHFTSGTSVVDEVPVNILKLHGSGLHLRITSRRFKIERTDDPHSLWQLHILPKKTNVQKTMNIAPCCQRISFWSKLRFLGNQISANPAYFFWYLISFWY